MWNLPLIYGHFQSQRKENCRHALQGKAVGNSGAVIKLTMQKFTERSLPARLKLTDVEGTFSG
jgi:hypothetical protein